MNTLESALLLVTLAVFLIFVGHRVGGRNGMLLAFMLSVASNFSNYFYSDKLALAMYSAQSVTRRQIRSAYEVVARLIGKEYA